MTLTPEWVLAICAGVTLLIFWTASSIGAVLWITTSIKQVKKEILADIDVKHKANEQTVKALEVLVIRHDTMLNPEFNGSGLSSKHRHS